MIQVIHRAFDIIEYIAVDPDSPKALGEIAEALELNAGTCANIIKTLTSRKYLEKIDKQKGYVLGPNAYKLSGNGGYQKSLVDAAKEEMEMLTRKINENSLLCMLKDDMRVVIQRVQSENDLQANTAGEKKVFDTASGRLLVAMLPDDELDKFTARFGIPSPEEWDGVKDGKTFMKQVSKVRKDGYAIQITKNQIIGMALPVKKGERVIAALSIYMPVFRFSASDKVETIKQIKKTAERISRKLS